MAEKASEFKTSLLYMLSEMNRGEDVRAAELALQELLEGLKQHGGKGSLVWTLKLESLKQLDNGVNQIQASTDVKITKPKGRQAPSVFFADDRPRRPLSPEEEVEAVRRLLGVMPRWREWLTATYGLLEARDLRIDLWFHPQGTIYQIDGRRYWACDLPGLVERVQRWTDKAA